VSGLSGNTKDLQAAVKLQELISAGDWTMCKGGISGTKAALERLHGYGGIPRRPILTFEEEGKSVDALMGELKELLAYEKNL
jgi:L-threo-3-deoxy-hexylosonate aldolase